MTLQLWALTACASTTAPVKRPSLFIYRRSLLGVILFSAFLQLEGSSVIRLTISPLNIMQHEVDEQ